MKTIFKKLLAAITAEHEKDQGKYLADLNEIDTLDKLQDQWRFRDMLTPARLKKAKAGDWTLDQVKEFIAAKSAKLTAKRAEETLAHLLEVEKAPDLESMTVTVNWTRNRTWGNNPTAEAYIRNTDGIDTYIGKASGCGYDKESTAIAQAVNQSLSFRKAMYLFKEKHAAAVNRELFGYGSGYGILPRLEGGVGTSCYPKIFGTIGFTFENVSSGKMHDSWQVRKLQKSEAPTVAPNPFGMLAAFSALAELTSGGDKAAANASKARMLKVSVPAGALSMPDDWEGLSEEEKERRLNGAIKTLSE